MLNNYALGLKQRGRYQESRTTFETLLKSLREVHGERHPDIANGLNNFALLLLETRSYEEAERAFRAAIEQWGALIGSEHQRTLIARHNLALSLMAQLRFDEAEVLLKEVFDKQSEASGGEIDTGNSAKTLARLMYKQQRTDEGLSYALQSTEILAKKYPVGHFRIAVAETAVAHGLAKQGRFTEAETVFLRVYPVILETSGIANAATHETAEWIAEMYSDWGKPELAEPFLEVAQESARQAAGDGRDRD